MDWIVAGVAAVVGGMLASAALRDRNITLGAAAVTLFGFALYLLQQAR